MGYSLPQQEARAINRNFYLYYFFIFFGFGSLFPLLSVYLNDVIGLTGSQIGTIMSLSPVIMILVQPLWGVLSDMTQRPTYLLTIALIFTAIFGLVYSYVANYSWIIIIAILLAITQSALIPLSDSIAMNYVQKTKAQYGSIRLWGAVGFAVSVLIVGWISDLTNLSIIFYGFSITLVIACVFAWRLPKENQSMKISIKDGLKELSNVPRYFIFLFVTFLVLGPILANNIYFGILISEVGGGLTGIGIAFLLAAGSEAPFMKVAGRMIAKMGIIKIIILATIVSALRWFLYFIEPPLYVIYLSTIAQGFSVGLFIPAAIQYVRDLAPKKVGATAISLYSAIGNGLGNWFCTFVGGLIMEAYTVMHVYLFFGCLSTIAIPVLIWFQYSKKT
ncbi:PPP family 3-phenylpropionic acid transporter [Metabacillus crassostreae]|uniref:MFS transporter n=1 Tax=Metabacillus crassostreae TaxID=929098 RepID=UPI00195923E1|nr:MFS transporter [Metabacillus crassostreae]MBM7606124.1 PPP family 3-phenylpropionic acid transporter [Metabacillus crassostreae]